MCANRYGNGCHVHCSLVVTSSPQSVSVAGGGVRPNRKADDEAELHTGKGRVSWPRQSADLFLMVYSDMLLQHCLRYG